MGSQLDFTSEPIRATFDGFLFDMDGTIIDSTPAIVKHWENLGGDIGVDPATILATSHGRRSIDVLKILAPEKANWEYVQEMEGRLPREHASSATEIPGARSLIDKLISLAFPWTIVTSGTRPLVTGWLSVLSLAIPEHIVTAEDVPVGKPDPECYLLGKKKLGIQDEGKDILVLEDAPAGIKAGKAAGCKVIGLVTSHTADQVAAAGPDWIVKDLESVKVVGVEGGKITIEISNALKC
ncbi:2-deoxyglucose-6-phosphate phosphatase [Emericellopsis cladophorae]|uniref:2-deoxyglucose-6-phosphate phosphatase n=1 Tax=Emericellopsis cladophorae TaxID=2686198 RepID=A0A9P9Y8T1_9HYPO|nr:2-deoxyglucose-6-phosphate phosphatase [Emericellopsis cladophorae]KAI6785576.1 2-deoxyglucose-6-phosphate phosphatase [Emericellopsis cladophorae]